LGRKQKFKPKHYQHGLTHAHFEALGVLLQTLGWEAMRTSCAAIADKAPGELASLPRTQRAYARPISSAALQTESQRAMMAHIRKFAHNHEHALRMYDDEV
jgi:hypothetical protein